MTNSIAVVLGILILGGIAADVMFTDTTALLFLAKKLYQLIEWIAFWR